MCIQVPPYHEPNKEPAVIQPLADEEQLPLSNEVQANQDPYDEEEQDEDDGPEGADSEPEEPLEESSGDPSEAGTVFTRIDAAALISFFMIQLRRLFKNHVIQC